VYIADVLFSKNKTLRIDGRTFYDKNRSSYDRLRSKLERLYGLYSPNKWFCQCRWFIQSEQM